MIPVNFLVDFIILIYSVILHEIAHGFVADKLGDPTARVHGRLTLNPIPHIDPVMTLVLPLLLILSGSTIIFGAAKPVPVDTYNLKDPKRDMALVALAGPATNLGIAAIFAILLRFLPADPAIADIFATSIVWNVGLAIFNLFPIPPLDGSKVIAGILPDDIAEGFSKLDRFGFLLVFGILIFFPGLIFGITSPLVSRIVTFLLP